MTPEQLGILIKKYLSGSASPEEKQALEAWYNDYDHNLEVAISDSTAQTEEELHDKILRRLRGTLQYTAPVKTMPVWKKLTAAAAVALLIASGAWYLLRDNRQPEKMEMAQETGITPGFEQAILTTSDGRKIELGKNAQNSIDEQNGVIINDNGNSLAYGTATTGNTVFFNTLEVPRKGMYSIGLADGTKVWLNSLSSLKYPTSFPGKERRVQVTGEAYFEVAKKASQPFIVEVDGKQEVEVLGTSFNVNAYPNESEISTTLLSGAVRVKAGSATQTLSPGQETQLQRNNSRLTILKDIDANDAVSWKNGYFVCNGKDLKAILRQVMRWYDIEVEYQGNIQPETFVGAISRNMDLSELLKVLEITGVHFSLNGKQLTVLP